MEDAPTVLTKGKQMTLHQTVLMDHPAVAVM